MESKGILKTFELSDELRELLSKKRHIQANKEKFARNHDYEKAARERDKERFVWDEILEFLKKEYDFKNSKQVEADIKNILNLVEERDMDFSNALTKINRLDLERMKIVRDVQEYYLEKISLDDLHARIQLSFEAVIEDFKKKINRLPAK